MRWNGLNARSRVVTSAGLIRVPHQSLRLATAERGALRWLQRFGRCSSCRLRRDGRLTTIFSSRISAAGRRAAATDKASGVPDPRRGRSSASVTRSNDGTNARQRTDQATRFVQPYCTTAVTDMLSQLVETGWQRFLDRLKQLLGKADRSDLPAAPASATDAPGASTPRASGDTPVPSTGGP